MNAVSLLALLTLGQGDPSKGPPRVEERLSDVVLVWNGEALDAIRADKTPPPKAARQLALLHAAIADALNVVRPAHSSLLIRLKATEEIDADAAVAGCAARLLGEFHPSRVGRFEKLRDAQTPEGGAGRRGTALGKYCAERYLRWRKDDVKAMKGEYRAPVAVGIWRPTPPGRVAALYPEWGKMKPLAVRGHAFLNAVEPPELTSEEYAKDFNEVKSLGRLESKTRTAEQTVIAQFWNDGPGTCTPPGHWNMIAQEVSRTRKLTVGENARLFALLNLALADAAVVCWECKYKFRLWRPITAIHEADRDANDATEKDTSWRPLLETPPFPTYTSGHSTFSGAGAAVLAGFFGKDKIPFEVRSDGYAGTIRSYKGFRQAADEAGRSRIYGGIHFECDNREGLRLGRAVGQEVVRTRLVPLR
jgi:hypothetical protein